MYIDRAAISLKQQVIDRLRGAILDGSFSSGQKLVEKDLCAMLGISRTLLREALQHLEAEQLITNVPHKGPMVAVVDEAEARAIYQVRQALEGLAGEGFAQNASAEQMHALRQSIEYLESEDVVSTTQKLLGAKNRFYEALLKGCGNQIVANVLTQLNNRITLLRRLSLAQTGRIQETRKELTAIADALESRNSALAKQLCEEHVAKAAQIAMKRFVSGD
ncbi:MAG TPA: GntR family transcriptional regulator [Eoetvoesiella sp.]